MGSSVLETLNKKIFSFIEYLFFTPRAYTGKQSVAGCKLPELTLFLG